MTLLKPVEDTKQSLVQDLILNTSGILVGAAIGDPTGIAAVAVTRIGSEVMHRIILPLTSRSESKRLYQWGKQAAEGIAQRSNDGEEFRKDGVFEDTPASRSNWEEVIESTLKKVVETTDEPKVKFMAHLTENFHFDQDLDIDTYRQLLNDLDELSYRQLCIIRLIILYEKQKVGIDRIDNIEQMTQSERTRFHSISRDFEQMMVDDSYLAGVMGVKTEDGEPCVFGLDQPYCTYQSNRLNLFANLCEIPYEDIEKTFSLWNVRVHKSEECND